MRGRRRDKRPQQTATPERVPPEGRRRRGRRSRPKAAGGALPDGKPWYHEAAPLFTEPAAGEESTSMGAGPSGDATTAQETPEPVEFAAAAPAAAPDFVPWAVGESPEHVRHEAAPPGHPAAAPAAGSESSPTAVEAPPAVSAPPTPAQTDAEAAEFAPVDAEAAEFAPVEAEAGEFVPVDAEAAVPVAVEAEAGEFVPVDAEAAAPAPEAPGSAPDATLDIETGHPAPQRPFVHDGGPIPATEPPMIIPVRAYYMTRADDTLRSVAAQFLNSPSRWRELRSLNAAHPGVADSGADDLLAVGTSLALPGDPMPWGKPDPVYLWTLAERFLYAAWGRDPSPEEVAPFWRGLTSGAPHLEEASAPAALAEPPIPAAMAPLAAPPAPGSAEAPAAAEEPEVSLEPPAEPEPAPVAYEPPRVSPAPPTVAPEPVAAAPVEPPAAAEEPAVSPEPPAEPEPEPAEPVGAPAYEVPPPVAAEPAEPPAVAAEPVVVREPEPAPVAFEPEPAPADPEPAPAYEVPPPVAAEPAEPPAVAAEPVVVREPEPAPADPEPAPAYEIPPPVAAEPAEPPAVAAEPVVVPEPEPAPVVHELEPAPGDPEPASAYEVPPPVSPVPPAEPVGAPTAHATPPVAAGGPAHGPGAPLTPEDTDPNMPAFLPSMTGAERSVELPVEQVVTSGRRAFAGTAIGDAMMLWKLGRMRRSAGAGAAPDPLELSLEQTARMDSLALTEAAMRHLRAVTVGQLKPKPRVLCVRTGAYGFEVLLDEAVAAPDGWQAASGGYVLELPRGVTVEQLNAVGRGSSLCPALVPVGDTQEGPLLLNIEEIGCLAVSGPSSATGALLTSIVETLGSSPLAGDIRIITVGVAAPTGPGWERIHATSYDSPELEHLLSTSHSATVSVGTGSVDVLVVGPGNDILFQRAGQIATVPGSRLALVGATSSVARWPWRIHVDEQSRGIVHPIAVNIVAVQAMRPELAHLLSETARAQDPGSAF